MTAIIINKDQFQTRFHELFSAAVSGVDVFVEEPGLGVVKLVVAELPKRGPLVSDIHPGAIMSEDFAEPLPPSW